MELNYMSKNLIGHEVFAHSIYATGMHLMELCSKVSSLALQSTSFFFFFPLNLDFLITALVGIIWPAIFHKNKLDFVQLP